MAIKDNLVAFGIKKGWKVFFCKQDELFSFSTWYRIKYKKDEWVHRPYKFGPLAIFKNKSFAEEFLLREDIETRKYKIKSIYYIPSVEERLYCLGPFDKISFIHRINLPFGTDFAESVFVPEGLLQDPAYINFSICGLY